MSGGFQAAVKCLLLSSVSRALALRRGLTSLRTGCPDLQCDRQAHSRHLGRPWDTIEEQSQGHGPQVASAEVMDFTTQY